MACKRTTIVNRIKQVLTTAGFFVSRIVKDQNDLRRDNLPAVVITNGLEDDNPEEMGDYVAASWDLHLLVYVYNLEDSQTELDEKMANVTKALCNDSTLISMVESLELSSRDTDRAFLHPFGMGDMTFTIRYSFNCLTEGG